MDKMKKVKLSDIAKIVMGQSPKSDFYNTNGDGLPFFQGRTEFGYLYPNIQQYCNKPLKVAQKDDVLMTVRAPVGDLNIAKEECIIGRGLCALSSKINNRRFLYYLLKGNNNYITSFGSGAVYDAINKDSVGNLIFNIPDEQIQCKISSILSAYDDLIENNTRRIQILEEIAQRIYREWFVDFRFPGHKKVKFIDSELGKIPEGWEVKSIMKDNTWNFVNENISKYEGEKEYFATANIEGIDIVKDGIFVSYDDKPSRAQKQPVVFSVWFARMKDTYKVLGFTKVNEDIANRSILSSGFAGFKTSEFNFPFIYLAINSDEFHQKKDQYCTGATQMSLTNDGLEKIKIIVPIKSIIEDFGKLTLPLLNKVFAMQKINKVLRTTRDLLLPKLISGELGVSDLDISIREQES